MENQFDALLRFVRPSITPDVKYDGFGINHWTGQPWLDSNPWVATEGKPNFDDAEENIDYSSPIKRLFHPETVTSKTTEKQHSATADPQEAQDLLSKRFATERRKAAIRAHVQRQLAIGDTIESLAKFARQHDEETALLIEEIGAELFKV